MPKTTPPHDGRMRAALTQARDQGYVVSRRQLYALGVTRWEVRGNVRARRWQLVGDQSVVLHNGEISRTSLLWAAVFQGGPRACLDGASALEAAGLQRFEHERIRVSVPRGARVRRNHSFDIRQTRRWSAADVVAAGVPRTRPAVAAVRGALWAVSDKQAVLLVTMAVQQGVAEVERVGVELIRASRPTRLLLHALVNELLAGAQSLGELDLTAELRRRRLPRPTRQVLRQDGRRRYYLDLYFEQWHVVVEIDGIHHAWAENIVADALRQNALSITGDTVLRVPLLGLRLHPDDFFAQIERALRDGGWPGPDLADAAA